MVFMEITFSRICCIKPKNNSALFVIYTSRLLWDAFVANPCAVRTLIMVSHAKPGHCEERSDDAISF